MAIVISGHHHIVDKTNFTRSHNRLWLLILRTPIHFQPCNPVLYRQAICSDLLCRIFPVRQCTFDGIW